MLGALVNIFSRFNHADIASGKRTRGHRVGRRRKAMKKGLFGLHLRRVGLFAVAKSVTTSLSIEEAWSEL